MSVPHSGFPRLYAAASLKLPSRLSRGGPRRPFSAALCRGLIEAPSSGTRSGRPTASFSAALCRGLIEAPSAWRPRATSASFSAALCRGLIEAPVFRSPAWGCTTFSAALCRGLIEASVKASCGRRTAPRFSAALCRGLIEAGDLDHAPVREGDGFPRLYAAASLKPT